MTKPKVRRQVFDPTFEELVPRHETTSWRIRWKLRQPFVWRFCELCWRSTEHAVTLEAYQVVEPLTGRNARPIPITAEMRQKAQQMADELVDRYERALKGEFGRYEPALMTRTYCNDEEIVGEITVEAFRDQVERGALLNVWGRKGVLTNLAQLPSQPAGAPKPSRLYCEHHNPRRSVEARRAYQRDRRFLPEFEALIDRIWMEESHLLSYRCAEDYVYVRSKAYQLIQEYKAPTIRIDELLAEGISSQAEIARRLGISRQAVSAAFKRRALRKVKAEKA